MTPEQKDALAKVRFTILSALRASGALIMLLGLWIWYSDALHEGGWPAVGGSIFILGFVESMLVPQFLAKRWRSDR